LTSCALYYLQARANATDPGCRFDVVAISGADQAIEWIRDAFTVAG